MQELDQALAEQAPSNSDASGMNELPTLALDGIPTPVDQMTQVKQNWCIHLVPLLFFVKVFQVLHRSLVSFYQILTKLNHIVSLHNNYVLLVNLKLAVVAKYV